MRHGLNAAWCCGPLTCLKIALVHHASEDSGHDAGVDASGGASHHISQGGSVYQLCNGGAHTGHLRPLSPKVKI